MYIFVENRLSKKAKKVKISINSYEYLDFCFGKDEYNIPNFNLIQKIEQINNKNYNTIWEYLEVSEEIGNKFIKWYNRKTIPYCKDNGINISEYPVYPVLLLEICKINNENYNIEDIITYFEYYLKSFKSIISLEFLYNIIENFKINKILLNNELMSKIIDTYPIKLQEYKNGKTNLLNFFFGEYLKNLSDKSIDKNILKLQIEQYLNNYE